MKEVKSRLIFQSQNTLRGGIMPIISTAGFNIKSRTILSIDTIMEVHGKKYVLKEGNK